MRLRAEIGRHDRRGLVDGHVAQASEQPLHDRIKLKTALDACYARAREFGSELEVTSAFWACSEPKGHSLCPLSRAGHRLRV